MPPKLLVSVRTPSEAHLAASENVQIIDIKEPEFGSLGMSEISDIHKCVKMIRDSNPKSQCSVACGEVLDWMEDAPAYEVSLPPVDYLKIGLARLASTNRWWENWTVARKKVESILEDPEPVSWIAVAYVDSEVAGSPKISEVIAAAVETNCRGVLFDTYEKNSLRFSDWVSDTELLAYLETIHAAGMFCSVAGRLMRSDIERLSTLPVDVLAVRSAVCEEGVRTAAVSRKKLRDLQSLIQKCELRV